MNHLIAQYDFPGQKLFQPLNSYPACRKNFLFHCFSEYNRHGQLDPETKKPTEIKLLLAFFCLRKFRKMTLNKCTPLN